MINPNELRIGNLLQASDTGIIGTIYKIDTLMEEVGMNIQVADYDRWDFEYKELDPISLSEEWLIKLWFEKQDSIYTVYKHKWNNYYICPRNGEYIFKNEDYHFCTIKSVHELQNIFFVITKEELTVK